MSLGKLVTETTRMAPSTPMRETFIARKMLAVCCVCRRIRGETRPFPGRERWVTPQSYRTTHGVNPADFPRTHNKPSTYCKGRPMLPIGKEATDFVDACEAIHALLEGGDALTPEDRGLIKFSANELLDKLTPA